VKVCFLADADLRKAIVTGVSRREPNVDFLSAEAGGLRGLSDPEVLKLASITHRVLVSHDVGTMPGHFRSYLSANGTGPGLILVPQWLEVGRVIEDLVLIWQASEALEWRGQIVWLPL